MAGMVVGRVVWWSGCRGDWHGRCRVTTASNRSWNRRLHRRHAVFHHIVKHHGRTHGSGIFFSTAKYLFSFVALHCPYELLKFMWQTKSHCGFGVIFRITRGCIYRYYVEGNAEPAAACFVELSWIFDSYIGDLIEGDLKRRRQSIVSIYKEEEKKFISRFWLTVWLRLLTL